MSGERQPEPDSILAVAAVLRTYLDEQRARRQRGEPVSGDTPAVRQLLIDRARRQVARAYPDEAAALIATASARESIERYIDEMLTIFRIIH